MSLHRPLDALFLANFSDACFRVTPSLAQMADDFDLRLTILHAWNPERERRAEVELKLRSFFPEADSFGICRRIALEGDLLSAVEQVNAERSIDLVIAPPSDPLGFLRILPSRRADLLRRLGTLLWTAGPQVRTPKLRARPRQIACWLDFEGERSSLGTVLRTAIKYAETLKAQLHIVHVLPDLLEGTLRPPSVPLHAAEVEEALRLLLPATLARPEIHVSAEGTRAIPGLLRRCDADLLVLGHEQATVSGLFGTRMSPLIGRAPCPTVCVGPQGARVALAPRLPAAEVLHQPLRPAASA